MLRLMPKTLPEYIRDELKRRGWSRRTLALYAEISPDNAARLARGEGTPNPETIRKVADALKVSETYLLRLAGHIEEPPRVLTDPDLIDLALEAEELPDAARYELKYAWRSLLDAIQSIVEQSTANSRLADPTLLLPVIEALAEKYPDQVADLLEDSLESLRRQGKLPPPPPEADTPDEPPATQQGES